jgi:nucleoside-diphosphate-sugar epimerase
MTNTSTASSSMPTATARGLARRVGKLSVDFLSGLFGIWLAGSVLGENVLTEVGAWIAATGFAGASLAVGGDRTVWYFVGTSDLLRVTVAGAFMSLLLALSTATGLSTFSPAAIILASAAAVAFATLARLTRRWHVQTTRGVVQQEHVPRLRRVLLVGASPASAALSLETKLQRIAGVEIVGILSEDPSRVGTSIEGIPVCGTIADLMPIAERLQVAELVFAMEQGETTRQLMRQAEDAGFRVRAALSLQQLLNASAVHRPGAVTLRELVDGAGMSFERYHKSAVEGSARRVLVTGGAGFIGSHLIGKLLTRGYTVRVLDSFAYGREGLSAYCDHPRLEVLEGDIANLRDVSAAVRDVEGVIALAAIVGDPACNLDPEETSNLNYAATKTLVEACNFYGVRRLVFASSCSVYGASDTSLLTETSRLNPVSLYARTRVLSENIIFDRAVGDLEPVVLRLSTVFGLSPRMRFDLVVNTLTVRAVVDGRIQIFGGDQWRPNVHCRDAATAFLSALEAPAANVAGEVFNVGGEALNHTIAEIGEKVASIVGQVDVRHETDAPDKRNYRVSFAKIRERMGFVPQYSVEDGIREIVTAVRADERLQAYASPIYSNVQALRERFESARRERAEVGPLD